MINQINGREAYTGFDLAVLKILQHSALPMTEYQLMCEVEQAIGEWPFDRSEGALLLFRKHFCIMNALYRIQHNLRQEGVYLQVDPLAIMFSLHQSTSQHQKLENAVSTEVSNLAEYYLNWDNFQTSTKETVESLLHSFWDRFQSGDALAESFSVFGLQPGDSWEDVKLVYRKMANLHHPDKGGDMQTFIEIRRAYETIKKTMHY